MHRVPSALAPAVFIPGLAYEALVRARNGLYSAALLRRRRLPAPVISIGNITMGGTGKTPLVIYVAQALAKLGFMPAILTRGYGRIRSSETHTLAPGETIPNPALTLGDEPALIRRHIPSSWMGVSKDRFVVGSILAKRDPRLVFVLDDGFQHRTLARDLDIVIIDSSQPLLSDRIFPRGNLREPVSALGRCDVIVINGPFDSPEANSIEADIRGLQTNAQIFHCNQFIQSLTPFLSWQTMASRSPEEFSHLQYPGSRLAAGNLSDSPSAYLVSALGNPERFLRDMQRLGIRGPGRKFYTDHHRLSLEDWQNCVKRARQKRADSIITTEKDAVKIDKPPDFPLLVAVQSTEMAGASEFELVLKKCIEERR